MFGRPNVIKAWVTRPISVGYWMNEVFTSQVSPANEQCSCTASVGLEDALLEEFSSITVKFLPLNMRPLIPPMDQNAISILKKLYTEPMFQRCFEVTSLTELSLTEF